MIVSMIKIFPPPGKHWEAVDIFRSMEGSTRIKPGCIDCGTYEAWGRMQAVLYLEKWETWAELDRHIQSDLYRRVLLAIELSGEEPEISFYEVSQKRGLEFIKTSRSADDEANS